MTSSITPDTTLLLAAVHSLVLLAMPFLMAGLINRTKSWWAGRKGPGLLQSLWDLLRLLRKRPVYSTVSTPVFRAGAWVVLAASVLAALIAPSIGGFAPMQFSRDFIVFAYALGLARLFLMLSALDVGSSFEGMGTAREASFTAFIEPALFLLVGTAALATGQTSFAGMLGQWHQAGSFPWLAAMQYAAAVKMTIYAGLIAALLNPFDPYAQTALAVPTTLALMACVAVAVGCVESLTARLRMRLVPVYLMGGTLGAAQCLAAAGWLVGSR